MASPVHCSELAGLLRDEAQLAARLLEVLRDEQGAMAARDDTALQQAVAAKEDLLAELESCHRRSGTLYQAQGVKGDKAGIEQMVTACTEAGDDRLEATWRELQETLRACQRQNEINGKVIATHRQVVQRSLAILLGGHAEGTELYTQDGKASAGGYGGRTYTKA